MHHGIRGLTPGLAEHMRQILASGPHPPVIVHGPGSATAQALGASVPPSGAAPEAWLSALAMMGMGAPDGAHPSGGVSAADVMSRFALGPTPPPPSTAVPAQLPVQGAGYTPVPPTAAGGSVAPTHAPPPSSVEEAAVSTAPSIPTASELQAMQAPLSFADDGNVNSAVPLSSDDNLSLDRVRTPLPPSHGLALFPPTTFFLHSRLYLDRSDSHATPHAPHECVSHRQTRRTLSFVLVRSCRLWGAVDNGPWTLSSCGMCAPYSKRLVTRPC
jgi:hypothetical protein